MCPAFFHIASQGRGHLKSFWLLLVIFGSLRGGGAALSTLTPRSSTTKFAIYLPQCSACHETELLRSRPHCTAPTTYMKSALRFHKLTHHSFLFVPLLGLSWRPKNSGPVLGKFLRLPATFLFCSLWGGGAAPPNPAPAPQNVYYFFHNAAPERNKMNI